MSKAVYSARRKSVLSSGFRVCIAVALIVLVSQGLMVAQSKTSGASDPAAVKIVKAYEDKLNLAGLDITNTFTLVQKRVNETDRVLQIKVYRRDASENFTLAFLYPDSEKGKGYWRNGDDLYLYLPSTREFVYRNRKDDVGGADVRTDLFGKVDAESQYWLTLEGTAIVAKMECDVIFHDAKKLDVAYPKQRWFVRKSDGLPIKVENMSASGALLRTTYYVDYKEIRPGKFLFTKLLGVDALEKGRQTFLSNEEISTARIADYTFSKAFLEEQSR